MRIFRRIMLGGGIDIDTLPDTQKLYYQATAKATPKKGSLGTDVIANKWDATTGEGIIICTSDIIKIGDSAFENYQSLKSVTIPDSVTSIGGWAFCNCTSLTSITIPDSVTSIGDYAFHSCDSLTSVTIPDSVTTIGESAFNSCSSLTSITIGDSVTTIGVITFWRCVNLKEFKGKFASADGRCLIIDGELVAFAPAGIAEYTIPNSVTTIGDRALAGCDITSVTIGDSVTSIVKNAFMFCNSLKSVYCKATTPPSLGLDVFYSNANGRKIYVPTESVEAYKSAINWSKYADAIVGYDFENNTAIE